jgi:hypothetical protein
MPIKFTTLYMPTKDGKLVARPCRKCPICYKVGKIVDHNPFAKNLDIIRICPNKKCDNEGQKYPCHQSWDEYTIPELEEYKKWLEENWESLRKKGESIRKLERGLKNVNEALERKKKKREENRVK